jgi:acyl-CoA thioester hydrolase
MRLHVPISLRWSDLDAYGHVNNASMFRLLEEARIQAFWIADHGDEQVDRAEDGAETRDTAIGATTAVLDGRPGANTLTLIARQEIEYLAQIPYLRQPLDIQLWVGRLGGADLDVCYEVHSPVGVEPAIVYSRAATTIVLVDAESGRPRRLRATERDAWTPYLGDPVRFTRR